MKKLILYFNTLKYLRWEQIYYRVKYKVFPLRKMPSVEQLFSVNKINIKFSIWQKDSWQENCEVTFLNKTKKIEIDKSWAIDEDALWLYNLHYFDDLNAAGCHQKQMFHTRLIDNWIRNNSDIQTIAFQPYPTSLRLVNWAKYLFRYSGNVPNIWLSSFTQQALVLVKRCEFHLLGNHLYANGKALIFAGVLINGELGCFFLKKGLEIIDRENNEQFLGDGGHFELSPMYHSILLMDLLELISLAKASDIDALENRVDSWINIALKSLSWMDIMQHPDGEIAFFNDASFGIAPPNSVVEKYASEIIPSFHASRNIQSTMLKQIYLKYSGYTIVQNNVYKALLDTAKIGASYLPGHAHADTLSFELSLNKHRFLVNSGTSMYGFSEEREIQRSTKSHNTVVVDGLNSSEIWGGFRVANRAEPFGLNTEIKKDELIVSCSHNGYLMSKHKSVHSRVWTFMRNALVINDIITGDAKQCIAYFYLHPDVKITKYDNKIIELKLGKSFIKCYTDAQEVMVRNTKWNSNFGDAKNNRCIELKFSNQIQTVFEFEKCA